jgi:2'-5' RNA ligase
MYGGATARLFVAVDPPLQVREELAEWARGVAAAGSARGALRLLEAHSLHLTLCFLGSRPVEEIEALSGALRSCAERVRELSVGAPLWLPPRRPRALAVEIQDRAGEMTRLQEHLGDALSEVSGWEPQRRRFRAHITVARMREGAIGARGLISDRSSGARPLPATPQLRFTPESIALYRSWLAPAGATYEKIATCELAPAGR